MGKRLGVPVVSKTKDQAAKQFSFLAPFMSVDNPTSSKLTRERLGWKPIQSDVLTDLDQPAYLRVKCWELSGG